MKGTRSTRLTALGICGLALLIVAYATLSEQPPAVSPTIELAPVTMLDRVERAGKIESSRGASTARSDRPAKTSLSDYDSAGTDEDVAWMQRNGYPTRAMTEATLAARGQGATLRFSGSPDPEAILEAEQIALNDPSRQKEAIQTLSKHAQSGSVYALETMARIYQDGARPDPIRAKAFMKAAEMRGNWAAGLAPLKHQLTTQQELYASVMAHQIIRNLSQQRERMRLPPLTVDTRPGLDQLIMEIDEIHRAASN